MLKANLKKRYGSLRMAALKLGISYTRLSALINGWQMPNQQDLERLGLTWQQFKRQVPDGRAISEG